MELTGVLCIYLYSSLKADRDLEAERMPQAWKAQEDRPQAYACI